MYPMNPPKNIILITIDCLRADHVGFMGYTHNTTPFLNTLAEEGIIFPAAFAVGPVTPVSFLSLMTSTYPLMYEGYTSISDERTTLAEVLAENGYDTAAFHSNPYLSRFYKYDRGFHTFYDSFELAHNNWQKIFKFFKKFNNFFKIIKKTGLTKKGVKQPHATAEHINRHMISWIKTCSTPFFAWIHYMDVHAPYTPPSGYLTHPIGTGEKQQLFEKLVYRPSDISEDDLQKIINLYDAEIKYTDHALQSLLTTIKDVLPDTVVIITSDHGDEFAEHGGFLHGPRLYDELLHVPLLMWTPSGKKSVIEDPVSLLDVAPTILHIADIPVPSNFQGRNLLAIDEREEKGVFSEVSHKREGKVTFHSGEKQIAYRTAEWKYIYRENGEDELYNIKEDPLEQCNLREKEQKIAEDLKLIITCHMEMENALQKSTSAEQEKIMEGITSLKLRDSL